MTNTLPARFYKGSGCPSSQSLLAYNHDDLPTHRARRVESHLGSCDFCSAELQLLTRHQYKCEEYSSAEMPLYLRRFAEHVFQRAVAPRTTNSQSCKA